MEVYMCVALIGGMDRLERNYISEAGKLGIDLRVFTKPESELSSKIKNVDAVVIFTNKVSHKAKREVMNIAKGKNIPVFMYHSCGICTLRDCLSCIKHRKVV
jgi:cellobiose-specific phosphotransferase system component IIB